MTGRSATCVKRVRSLIRVILVQITGLQAPRRAERTFFWASVASSGAPGTQRSGTYSSAFLPQI